MSGECSGPSSRTSVSSADAAAAASRLAVRSTKFCKSPAPKASPSTFSTVHDDGQGQHAASRDTCSADTRRRSRHTNARGGESMSFRVPTEHFHTDNVT
ncbi:hypothetical protein EYF80_027075 [Liparis tanakae]|uniref:Uncharacterized protein n=1 Tax=Liparis tanakae TaxID=230148 RepID=A0A4Z2HCJ3_9TELE|nr:hypothetical protein EYF80_027075 [Liparis tanakae]